MAQAELNFARWDEIKKVWSDNRWLYVVAGILIGIMSVPAIEQATGDLSNLIGNLVPETIGIIFTVIFLDKAADNRAEKSLKQELLSDLHSQSNDAVINALRRLREKDWLKPEFLVGKNFERANWERAYIGNLEFHNCRFFETNFKAASIFFEGDTQIVNFRGCNLNFAVFENAQVSSAIFEDADLSGANLNGAILDSANMRNARLSIANLGNSDLSFADLDNATLNSADLQNADLGRASLKGADLESADLQNAKLHYTDLTGASLAYADLSNVSLRETIMPDGTVCNEGDDIGRFTDVNHPNFLETLFDINQKRSILGIDFAVPMPWAQFYYSLRPISFIYQTQWAKIHKNHNNKRMNSIEIQSQLNQYVEDNKKLSEAVKEIMNYIDSIDENDIQLQKDLFNEGNKKLSAVVKEIVDKVNKL